jgi:hypothetical protein
MRYILLSAIQPEQLGCEPDDVTGMVTELANHRCQVIYNMDSRGEASLFAWAPTLDDLTEMVNYYNLDGVCVGSNSIFDQTVSNQLV